LASEFAFLGGFDDVGADSRRRVGVGGVCEGDELGGALLFEATGSDGFDEAGDGPRPARVAASRVETTGSRRPEPGAFPDTPRNGRCGARSG